MLAKLVAPVSVEQLALRWVIPIKGKGTGYASYVAAENPNIKD